MLGQNIEKTSHPCKAYSYSIDGGGVELLEERVHLAESTPMMATSRKFKAKRVEIKPWNV